ncbi:hypothetical protein FNV43_RR09844 [Rhamnella rubrinervis]|uniref:Uncharacterized protein n=1 Tax=Rhamnella rubrinervis TaxID=2594499 RepID=A0A8K0MK61_9ROSA|nr:hypothetical protein FNV43_RR09844 [Rhamnella rubrinervis]
MFSRSSPEIALSKQIGIWSYDGLGIDDDKEKGKAWFQGIVDSKHFRGKKLYHEGQLSSSFPRAFKLEIEYVFDQVLLVTGNEDFVIDLPGQPQVNFQHYAGYVKRARSRPKTTFKAQRIVEEQLKVAKERAKAVEKMNEELVKQIAELKACQDGMEASIYEKLQADMRQHFEGQG